MIIDVHHHLISEPGYVDALLREMDLSGIEKTGLIAMGTLFEKLFVTTGEPRGPLDETDVLEAMKAHPDRFYGYVYIRPGFDGPEKVHRWGEQGFKGVKLHIPAQQYGHPDYLSIYESARELGMVCLFHTGIFKIPRMPGERISSENCRPIHIEAIVNELPDLRVILAHLGVGWFEEACTLARFYDNVHLDMSGAVGGWRWGKPVSWFQEMLYWPSAADKLLFGSDVHASELAETLENQVSIVRAMGWNARSERKFLYENARILLR